MNEMEQLEQMSEDLGKFLDYGKWEADGRSDGYTIHTTDYLRKKKNSFVSEFNRLIEKRVDELKEERLRCKTMLADLGNSESTFVEKLRLRLEMCEEYILDLHNEKNLSKSYDGLVRSIVTQYEVGFDQGMNDYLTDNILLNRIKRL